MDFSLIAVLKLEMIVNSAYAVNEVRSVGDSSEALKICDEPTERIKFHALYCWLVGGFCKLSFLPFEFSGFANAVVAADTPNDGTHGVFRAVNVQVSPIPTNSFLSGQEATPVSVVLGNEVPLALLATLNVGNSAADVAFESEPNLKLSFGAINKR